MIRLLEQDAGVLEALESPERFSDRHGADVSLDLELARGAVEQTLDFQGRVGARSPWVGYLSVACESSTVVGCGGFKGNPDAGRAVEIAYFTFPRHEGRGLATEMARALVGIAVSDPGVVSVLAHTLPERNASTRILHKLGFEHLGEVQDPEDGTIWRWRLT